MESEVCMRNFRIALWSVLGFFIAFVAPVFTPGSWVNRVVAGSLCGVLSANPAMCGLTLVRIGDRAVAADVPVLVAQRSSEFDDVPAAQSGRQPSMLPTTSSSRSSQSTSGISGKWQFDFGWFAFDPSDVDGTCRVVTEAEPFQGEINIDQSGENLTISPPSGVPMRQGSLVGDNFNSSGEAPLRWQGKLNADGTIISGIGTCGRVSQPFKLTRLKSCRKSQIRSIDQAMNASSSNPEVPAFPGQVSSQTPLRPDFLENLNSASNPDILSKNGLTLRRIKSIGSNLFESSLLTKNGSKLELFFELAGNKILYKSARFSSVLESCEEEVYSYKFSDNAKRVDIHVSPANNTLILETVSPTMSRLTISDKSGSKTYDLPVHSNKSGIKGFRNKSLSSKQFPSRTKDLLDRYTDFADSESIDKKVACGVLSGLCDLLPGFQAAAAISLGIAPVAAPVSLPLLAGSFAASLGCFLAFGGVLPPLPGIPSQSLTVQGVSAALDLVSAHTTLAEMIANGLGGELPDAREWFFAWSPALLKFGKSLCPRPKKEPTPQSVQPQQPSKPQEDFVKATIVGPTTINPGESTVVRIEFQDSTCNATTVTLRGYTDASKTINLPSTERCSGKFDFTIVADNHRVCNGYEHRFTAFVPGVSSGNGGRDATTPLVTVVGRGPSSGQTCYAKIKQ
jgi:hypothetical protein